MNRHLDRRTRDLAAIHVGAKQLGMDRSTYEALLQRIGGVTSSAKLDERGRRAVRDELERLGATNPRAHKGRPKNMRREPMLTKIEALLAELKAPWSYADALAQHMFGIERCAWLRKHDQLRAVIAALDSRRAKLQRIAAAERCTNEPSSSG
ncbi:MAG TPA: regulatory protein GemA [Rhodanobacteraceae bacterium]|nr:regulatory protein GemA [Rhodanobacteraceae bacterium]